MSTLSDSDNDENGHKVGDKVACSSCNEGENESGAWIILLVETALPKCEKCMAAFILNSNGGRRLDGDEGDDEDRDQVDPDDNEASSCYNSRGIIFSLVHNAP